MSTSHESDPRLVVEGLSIKRFDGPAHRSAVLDLAATTLRLVEERERSQRALVDPLTGLANVAALAAELPRYQEHALASGDNYIVGFVDLNNVKSVNDLSEDHHSLGDEYIFTGSRAVRKTVYPTDKVYRVGGDEFIFFLPLQKEGSLGVEELQQILQQRLADGFEAEMIESEGFASVSNIPLGLSLGLALWNAAEGESFELARSRADHEMYLHKQTSLNKT